MKETTDLEGFFIIMKQHLVTILVSILAGLSVAGIMTFFVIVPQYRSQAQMVVALPQNSTMDKSDTNTYKDLIISDVIMNRTRSALKDKYKLSLSPESIKNAIQVNQFENSQMLSIEATSTKAINAERIANTTANVFQKYAKDMLGGAIDQIIIISKAVANVNPVSPNHKSDLKMGLILGLLVGVGLAFLLSFFDRTVKNSKFVTDELDLTLLGTVPQMTDRELDKTTLSRHARFTVSKSRAQRSYQNTYHDDEALTHHRSRRL